MTERVQVGSLQVAKILFDFANSETIPGTGVSADTFWTGAEAVISDLTSKNKALLTKRGGLQAKINSWHQAHAGQTHDAAAYKAFLEKIGCLLPEAEDFQADTQNVDDEITHMAGPQLAVPVINAYSALNTFNTRQDPLYDVLYGTDVISEEGGAEKGEGYNKAHGDKVTALARTFLDEAASLKPGSHVNAISYSVKNGALVIVLENGSKTALKSADQLLTLRGDAVKPQAVLLKHNGLHFEIQTDPSSPVGQTDAAGVKDVLMEAVLTTIMGCEDSVAAVDTDDKVVIYRNQLDLMKGGLVEEASKGGSTFTRTMDLDRVYIRASGSELTLHGCSLLFVRSAGRLMANDVILDKDGSEVPEGIQDSLFTSLITIHDLSGNTSHKNSHTGSVYIVKPKMYSPEEVAFANELLGRVEGILGLPRNTPEVDIMDEERHTTVSLKVCIRTAKDRAVFTSIGFLDRTGNEIHISMEADAVVRKGVIESEKWTGTYENNNVDVGPATGPQGKAQIGKGMWVMSDLMAAMLEQRIGHPLAGTNAAWVPSPIAVTLYVLYYRKVDVFTRQAELTRHTPASADDILAVPLASNTNWTTEEIKNEVDNNAQGTLGYVIRRIDQGVGCSKVLDINDVGLMGDRATLCISSQLLTNWLRHGVISQEQVVESLKRTIMVVDRQNASDSSYRSVVPNFDDNAAFQAALELVAEGTRQPNGYIKPVLHHRRHEFEAKNGLQAVRRGTTKSHPEG